MQHRRNCADNDKHGPFTKHAMLAFLRCVIGDHTHYKSAFRQFKVIQGHWFWYQSKARMHFLLVSRSNLGLILHRFRDIAGFCAHDRTLFHPNFRGVPIRPDRPCWVSPCTWTSQTDGRTDRQTDRQTDRRHIVA